MNIEQKIQKELEQLKNYIDKKCREWLDFKDLQNELLEAGLKNRAYFYDEKLRILDKDIDYCRAQVHILEKLMRHIKGE